jgi:hypothetical protein
MNKKDNGFKFWAPIEISKGEDAKGEEVMKLGGIASTIDEDADGEFLDPNGFDIDDFRNVGVVNWHHQAKDQPATIIGEPTKVELRPDGFYVETTLYKSSKVAQDVWELAQTMKRDSKTRRLGYSIEGQVVERGSDDENNPAYNIVKKSKITGLAITHMPKNPKTFAEIIKGFSGDAMSEGSDTVSNPYSKSSSEENDEEDGLSTKSGKALVRASVDKDLKILKKSFKIKKLDENTTIDKIFQVFTNINIEKARNIFTILKAMNNKKVTQNQIEKAMDSLGLSFDENNPFLIKGMESEKMDEDESPIQKRIKESGQSKEEMLDKIRVISGLESENEMNVDEDEEEDEMDEDEMNETKKDSKIEKSDHKDMNKAIINILTKRIEKGQSDNFNQNKGIATLLKAVGEKLQELNQETQEIKSVTVQQNRIIKGLMDTISGTPQPRKSLTKSFTEKESFQKAQNSENNERTLSMKNNYKQVLDLVDGMSFSKGYDAEMSKATMAFESNKSLPKNIISRIQSEAGITIID